MTNEELRRALIVERFRDVEHDPEIRQRPASHGGADTDRARSARRHALSRALNTGNRE